MPSYPQQSGATGLATSAFGNLSAPVTTPAAPAAPAGGGLASMLPSGMLGNALNSLIGLGTSKPTVITPPPVDEPKKDNSGLIVLVIGIIVLLIVLIIALRKKS